MAISTGKIILASGSPRRKELLSKLGYQFDIVIPDLDETPFPGENPAEHVLRLSLAKAQMIAKDHPNDLIIGADTIVVLDNTILGKPASPIEAISMLKFLSGKSHIVYTGLSLVIRDEIIFISKYDATTVVFNNLDEKAIQEYVASGEPLDKAGAYGIQGMGSFLVNRYDGEFDTVIGFPTKLFKKMYEEVVSCRNH
jgi:septum formation protein